MILFISGCSTLNDVPQGKVETSGDAFRQMEEAFCSKESTGYYASSDINIIVYNRQAIAYEDIHKMGYCFKYEYLPDKESTTYIERYPPTCELCKYSPSGVAYSEASFDVQRFSANDKINITYNGVSKVYDLRCSPHIWIQHDVFESRPETYDCMFKGKTISINNTYEQLQGQLCDSYPVYCGE